MKPATARDTVSWCPDCGFRSKTTTSGLAAHALRLHTCQRHRDLAERKQRGDQQRAAVKYTRRPCLHKQARHEHGDYRTYVLDDCRCTPCRAAKTAYERKRHRQQGYGTWQPYVDATPAREHVLQLQRDGLGLKRIAQLSGVPHGGLTKLIYGVPRPDGSHRTSQRIRHRTADALLAVHANLDVLGDTVTVDGTGTRRRLQALVAIGWSQNQLAALVGMQAGNFSRTLVSDRVRASTARAVRRLYAEIHDTPPTPTNRHERGAATRARQAAAAAGWLSPGWWDDDTLDDPTYTPPTIERRHWSDVDDVAVQRAIAGDRIPLTRAERITAILELHDRGWSQLATARQLHLAPRQVARDLAEHSERLAS